MKASDKNEMNKVTRKGLADSFRNAFSGISVLVISEKNARIHILIMILVVIAGLVLRISPAHWITIALASGLVMASECFNTAVEYLSDSITSEYDLKIKRAKDVAAAGVLISAIVAVIIGLIIFIPAIIRFFDT